MNFVPFIFTDSMDPAKKSRFKVKANECINRAKFYQKNIDDTIKKAGYSQKHVEIKADSIGNSYDSLFGRHLDCDVISVHIEDPYIRYGNFSLMEFPNVGCSHYLFTFKNLSIYR